MDVFAALLHETLVATTLLSLPILGIATLVGIAIAVVQAATSLQEQSIGVLPKLGLVGMMIALGAPWGMSLLIELFRKAIAAMPMIVAGTP